MLDLINSLNQTFFFHIYNLGRQNPLLDNLMIFGANYLIFIALAATLMIFFTKDRQSLPLTGLSLSLGFAILQLFHLFVYEPRPFVTFGINPLIDHIPDASFPSTHSTILSILALSFFQFKSKYRQVMLVPVVWTGFARVYTGVHYPVDILGGFLVGALSVNLAWHLKQLFFQRR